MADEGMVALRDALGKILQSEHADLLREGLDLAPLVRTWCLEIAAP